MNTFYSGPLLSLLPYTRFWIANHCFTTYKTQDQHDTLEYSVQCHFNGIVAIDFVGVSWVSLTILVLRVLTFSFSMLLICNNTEVVRWHCEQSGCNTWVPWNRKTFITLFTAYNTLVTVLYLITTWVHTYNT